MQLIASTAKPLAQCGEAASQPANCQSDNVPCPKMQDVVSEGLAIDRHCSSNVGN